MANCSADVAEEEDDDDVLSIEVCESFDFCRDIPMVKIFKCGTLFSNACDVFGGIFIHSYYTHDYVTFFIVQSLYLYLLCWRKGF